MGGEVIFQNMIREPAPWWKTFHAFSTTHAIVAVIFLALVMVAVELGQRWRGDPRLRRAEIACAVAMIAIWLANNIWSMLPGQFDPAQSLPLHICDLASLIAPLALLTRWRILRALLYYWGLGLTTQAFITPLLHEGPGTMTFWFFWLNHFIVVGTAIYDLAVGGFWPRARDYLIGATACLLYLATILPLDVAFGFNYGYLGKSKPNGTTMIDALGPWPGRVVVIVGLVALVMALMTLPWEVVRRSKLRSAAREAI